MTTDTPTARISRVIQQLAAPGATMVRDDGSPQEVRQVSVPPEEGEALERWITREKATHTIEIGLAYGVSALHICRALVESGHAEATHVAIDPFQAKFCNSGLRALADAGVSPMIEFHPELSQVVLPAMLKAQRQFDFAFVDGNHRFDSVFVDLFYLGRLVRKGGVIFLDDWQLPGIRRAGTFFVKNLGWRIEEECDRHEKHHWAVLRTADAEDTRDYRYFVDF